MSEAIIAKKAEQVAIVAEKMKAAASIVVVDSRGLTVDQDTVLRRNLRESGVEFKVIKNSILSRAAEEAGLEDLKGLFVGPSAVAFSNEDVIAPAKVISEFAKGAEALEIKGGVVDGGSLQSKKSTLLHHFQTKKVCFLCSFLYFKRQCATLHTLSKRLQKAKKTVLHKPIFTTRSLSYV